MEKTLIVVDYYHYNTGNEVYHLLLHLVKYVSLITFTLKCRIFQLNARCRI